MKSRFFGSALGLFVMTSVGWSVPADVAGVYTSVYETPLMQFNSDGTKKEIGSRRIAYSLELNRDGTLRSATTAFASGKDYTTYGRGVWQLKEDRLYFVTEAVPSAGVVGDSRYLGLARVSVSNQDMSFSEVVGFPLGAKKLIRTPSAELGPVVSASDVAELKTVLTRLVGPVPRPNYEGVASEAALKAIVREAVTAGDVEALMRVSYPLMAGLEPDPQFNTYVAYMKCMAFSGVPQVREESEADAEKHLAQMKKGCDCVFPDSVSPRGMFFIGRISNDGRSGSSSGFFYGTVAGKWAILGNPFNPKAAEEKRRG